MSELPISIDKLGELLDGQLPHGNLKAPLEVHKLSEVDNPVWTFEHVHIERRMKKLVR